MIQRILRGIEIALTLVILAILTGYSVPTQKTETEQARRYTRQVEFNYITWIADALKIKMRSASIGAPFLFGRVEQKQIVMEHLRVTQQILEKEYALEQIYADPNIADKISASQTVQSELEQLYARSNQIAPLAESILQQQITDTLAELGLTTAGQPVPNVWYHSTPLPMALIISPRNEIKKVASISLETDITVDKQAALEARVDEELDVSSLVTPIGGMALYPTMVMRSTDLKWTLNTIAHEWIHNYLTLRPLGFRYMESPALTTMNETAASIAGDEIGALVIETYYPELNAARLSPTGLISFPYDHPNPGSLPRPPFDFREAMHETRVQTDKLLAEGKIEEAEAYMEARRLIFIQNGRLLRKINQAYFAFYGAYADVPGGAAGEDPVGPAVRKLRAKSKSLAEFINTIAKMKSFEELQEAVK